MAHVALQRVTLFAFFSRKIFGIEYARVKISEYWENFEWTVEKISSYEFSLIIKMMNVENENRNELKKFIHIKHMYCVCVCIFIENIEEKNKRNENRKRYFILVEKKTSALSICILNNMEIELTVKW